MIPLNSPSSLARVLVPGSSSQGTLMNPQEASDRQETSMVPRDTQAVRRTVVEAQGAIQVYKMPLHRAWVVGSARPQQQAGASCAQLRPWERWWRCHWRRQARASRSASWCSGLCRFALLLQGSPMLPSACVACCGLRTLSAVVERHVSMACMHPAGGRCGRRVRQAVRGAERQGDRGD